MARQSTAQARTRQGAAVPGGTLDRTAQPEAPAASLEPLHHSAVASPAIAPGPGAERHQEHRREPGRHEQRMGDHAVGVCQIGTQRDRADDGTGKQPAPRRRVAARREAA